LEQSKKTNRNGRKFYTKKVSFPTDAENTDTSQGTNQANTEALPPYLRFIEQEAPSKTCDRALRWYHTVSKQ